MSEITQAIDIVKSAMRDNAGVAWRRFIEDWPAITSALATGMKEPTERKEPKDTKETNE
jgi:hypothetical protein